MARGAQRAVLDSELRDGLSAGAGRHRGGRAVRPTESLRSEQTGAGAAGPAVDSRRRRRPRRARVQSHRTAAGPVLRRLRLCATYRRHRERPLGPRDLGGQPRRAARSHGRPRHGAGVPADHRAGGSGPAVQRLLGACRDDQASARPADRAGAVPGDGENRPSALSSQRQSGPARRSVETACRARMAGGDSTGTDGRRPPRILAPKELMKVLVTGGTGYLARAVVRALAGRGHDLVVFGRSATGSELPGTMIDGDVRDAAALERAAVGCDAISHSAALVSIWRRRRQDYDDVNVDGLRHVLGAAHSLGIRRIVYTSSFLALSPRDLHAPIAANDYQRTKVAADRLGDQAVQGGSPLIRVYPGVIYGPGVLTEGNLVGRLIGDHLRGRLPGLVGPENFWSDAYVDDVAAGLCAALERGAEGSRYVLGGENAPQ